MTSLQLLRSIGSVEDDALLDAERFLSQTVHVRGVRKSVRTILLAAVLVLLLLGATAFAAGAFGLRAVQDDRPQFVDDPVANLTGLQGSPVYQASQEWNDWKTEASRRGINRLEPETDTSSVYARHGAFSEEAKAKLCEIVEKYGLRLPDHRAVFAGIGGLYELLDESGFLPMPGDTGGYPRNGILWDDGSIWNLLDAVRVNGKDVYIELYRTVKGSFLSGGIRSDPDLMEEWNFSAGDGTDLILGIGPYQSVIMADLPNSFLFIIVKSGTGETGTGAPITDGSLNARGWANITKEDLETLADSFDYGFIDSIR